MELGVLPASLSPITLYCDNSGGSGSVKGAKRPQEGKACRVKVQRGDMTVTKIATTNKLTNPFTKALPSKVFDSHLDSLGLRCNSSWL